MDDLFQFLVLIFGQLDRLMFAHAGQYTIMGENGKIKPNQALEQVTTGYSFAQSGKRTDALLKTRGYISSLCFVEIKTHTTPLLHNKEPYRAEKLANLGRTGGTHS